MQNPADPDQLPQSKTSDALPVIDIGDLKEGIHGKLRSVREIADACAEWGFFQVVNHGLPPGLVQRSWEEMQAFFALPQRVKEACQRSRDNPWGYFNNELTKNQRDKKEVFDYTTDGTDPVFGAANRWPDCDPDIRSVFRQYRDACASLSHQLLEAMGAGIGLHARYLKTLCEPNTSFVRLNYYPVADPLQHSDDVKAAGPADLGIHHHTDAGVLTILQQRCVSGLQVQSGEFWFDVPPVDGALVINTGDMMQVWSNDRYVAPIHRVLAMDTVDRYSIAYFYNPRREARIQPLEPVIDDRHPPKYRPFLWGEFRSRRSDGDYADYGPEVQVTDYRVDSLSG